LAGGVVDDVGIGVIGGRAWTLCGRGCSALPRKERKTRAANCRETVSTAQSRETVAATKGRETRAAAEDGKAVSTAKSRETRAAAEDGKAGASEGRETRGPTQCARQINVIQNDSRPRGRARRVVPLAHLFRRKARDARHLLRSHPKRIHCFTNLLVAVAGVAVQVCTHCGIWNNCLIKCVQVVTGRRAHTANNVCKTVRCIDPSIGSRIGCVRKTVGSVGLGIVSCGCCVGSRIGCVCKTVPPCCNFVK
jgi:hypothetical protein